MFFTTEENEDTEKTRHMGKIPVTVKAMCFHHPFVTYFIDVTHWRDHAVGVTGFGHGERIQAGLRRCCHESDMFYHRGK